MKIIKFPMITLALIVATSCSSDLLNTNPEVDKEATNFYKTAEEIEQGVNGAYNALALFGQYKIAIPAMGEIPSDNSFSEVPANDGGFYGQMDMFNISPLNEVIENHWKDHYIGIQRCNVVLNRIDGVEMNTNLKNSRIGEMHFLRGLMYFNLVTAYGDVPLALDETTDVNFYFGKGRTPKSEIYMQIEKDLRKAAELLPDMQTQKGRASKSAALGILGRVLLTQKKYNHALIELEKIENKRIYGLLDDPEQIFDTSNENNKEIIFDINYTNIIDGNSQASNAYQFFMPSGTVNGAKGHNLPTKEIAGLYAENDLRKNAYIGLTNVGIPFTKKLKAPAKGINVRFGDSNIPVIRYADVLLMIAECKAQIGTDLQNALTYLNKLKIKRGLAAYSSTDKNKVLEEIDLERRKEFVSEGLRWFDLIRTEKAIPTMKKYFAKTPGYNNAQIDENKLLYPVPQSQINTDPSIKQNPGY